MPAELKRLPASGEYVEVSLEQAAIDLLAPRDGPLLERAAPAS